MVEEFLPEARAELLEACRLLEAEEEGLGHSPVILAVAHQKRRTDYWVHRL